MTLSNHAKKRIMQRNKLASDLTPKEIFALLPSAEMKQKGEAHCYILKEIDLVLVVNPENEVVMTVYNYSTAKGLHS